MRKIFAAFLGLFMAMMILFGIQSPAVAGDCTWGVICGRVTHATDDGYDPPIKVRCDYGNNATIKYIYEGQNSGSSTKCGQFGNGDMDEVYVRDGEELWCFNQELGYVKEFDATGYHKVNDLWNKLCVLHVD